MFARAKVGSSSCRQRASECLLLLLHITAAPLEFMAANGDVMISRECFIPILLKEKTQTKKLLSQRRGFRGMPAGSTGAFLQPDTELSCTGLVCSLRLFLGSRRFLTPTNVNSIRYLIVLVTIRASNIAFQGEHGGFVCRAHTLTLCYMVTRGLLRPYCLTLKL